MHAEDVVALYTLLEGRGAELWVLGGWGIDALLGQQTRPHKDLDLLARFDDLVPLTALLAEQGFRLKEIWSENRWAAHELLLPLIGREGPGGYKVATAFVLKHADGRELDFHILTLDAEGRGIPDWDAPGFAFSSDGLAGHGVVAGVVVRCLSAEVQMATHTGYTLQEKDLEDLRNLHERLGVPYLEAQAHLFTEG